MFKKISIFLAAVMLVALGAGSSFAFGTYGDNYVDGMLTGTTNGAATNVFVNPQGTGDALIYGYYNVRSNMGNLFTVTNTSSTYGVRARIRFIEAKNSCEVLDFDICLSHNDVWTAYLLNNGGVANLNVIDTDTAIDTAASRGQIAGLLPTLFPSGIDMRFGNAVQCTVNTDSAATTVNVGANDTLEGYFIVIAEDQLSETNTGGTTCGVKGVNGATKTLYDDLESGSVDNVLFGNDYSISLVNGNTYAYNATAIGDFTNGVYSNPPIAASPNLADGDDGLTGLNFALTKSSVSGSYYDIGSGTEMILTFPTKRITQTSESNPSDIFDSPAPTLNAGPAVLMTAYDTAQNSKVSVCQLSPCPQSTETLLPYEVNVININKAAIFDSSVEVPVSIDYTMGWLNIDLVNALTGTPAVPAHATTVSPDTAMGLPAIGYVTSDITSTGWNWMLPLVYTNTVN